MIKATHFLHVPVLALIIAFAAWVASGQTTTFVYQGKLQDGGIAANGTYEFEFRLYDSMSGGNQVGVGMTGYSTTVTNGIFAASLNFGTGVFNSPEFRFLEIGVRLAGSGQPYTALQPRQQVTSTPFAIRAISSQQAESALISEDSNNLGGIPAAQYVVTTDSRMSDARVPLPGSPSYIQNTQNQQAVSNFNISGEGKASQLTGGVVNATSEFQQGGARVLRFNDAKMSGFVGLFAGTNSTGNENMFTGYASGYTNTTGGSNTFFGSYTGTANTTASNNSFFGAQAGNANTIGKDNSFFGMNAGTLNTTGNANAFFGRFAGGANTTGGNNAYFGNGAGQSANGSSNAYFGYGAGLLTTTGFGNTFIGANTGFNNTTGSNNTLVGSGANVSGGFLTYATAIGAGSVALWNNSITLGRANGVDRVTIPGDLDVTGDIEANGFTHAVTLQANTFTAGTANFIGNANFSSDVNFDDDVTFNGSLTAGGISASGALFSSQVKASSLGLSLPFNGGDENACMIQVAGYFQIAHCSSSRRYKDEIKDYSGGLDKLMRLRPVSFRWKNSGQKDVGFVAEEINNVEPLLNNFNSDGEIEGVKYAQISTVLVNAVKEQQTQIESLEETIKKQELQLTSFKALLCKSNPTEEVCKQ